MSEVSSALDKHPNGRVALSVLLAVSFVVVAWVAAPLWAGIVLGTTLAFAVEPVYRRITPRVPPRLASAGLTVLTALACLAVVAVVGSLVVRELIAFGDSMQRYMVHGNLADILGERGLRAVERLNLDQQLLNARIQRELTAASRYAVDIAGTLLNSAAHVAVALCLAAMTMYYVLIEWMAITLRLERISPLRPRHTRALLTECRVVGRTALVGTIATGLVQGALGGVGYAMLGVPQPVLWAMLTAFASLVPVVGTALVWGPMALMLFLADRPVAALFLVAWGLLVVMALSDYVIRPRLVDRGTQGQPLLMLIAILGGLETLGPIGLFMGPILMSLFLAVFRLYERDFLGESEPRVDEPAPEPRPGVRRASYG